MPEVFSFSREFDYVRLDGLSRATGRPPHEWDLYIIKELIDNALDADEVLWVDDPSHLPHLDIHIEYINVSGHRSQKLFVTVRNHAIFPVREIGDLFATKWYTSFKAFTKGLTRGALGNALKTLLGIPYALRNCVAGDWNPELKPMSIICNGIEYLPRYVVDSTAQTVHFEYNEQRKSKNLEGTVIRVSLDNFVQERPRTLIEIETLAQQYHLCNPHVQFHWTIEMGGQPWKMEYAATPKWRNKFRGAASVRWYSLAAFRELLGALYRKQLSEKKGSILPIEFVCQYFAGFNPRGKDQYDSSSSISTIARTFGQSGLTATDIHGPIAMQLYQMLYLHNPRFEPKWLGGVGQEHVRKALTSTLSIVGDILYDSSSNDNSDPNVPFVIEAAIARLNSGKRQIWSAINFSPTYVDPFFSRWLDALVQPSEPVLGLGGLLDAYDIHDDVPVVLFLHLICPNVEHHEFSKSEINHLPFKHVLGEVLDRLLTAYKQSLDEEEFRREQKVFRALNAILEELNENNRFILDQLIEKLCIQLSQDPAFTTWLDRPEARARLQMYVARYQKSKPVLTRYVVRPMEGMLSIPSHPDRHFSVLMEHVSLDLLAKYHVNKILHIQIQSLETMIIDNGWLCRMDVALLRNLFGLHDPQKALFQCAVDNDLPILVLHDADEAGRSIVERMREWLEKGQLNSGRIIDLGLNTIDGPSSSIHPTKLVEMMPYELEKWLLMSFSNLGIPTKSTPSGVDIRRDITKRFDKLLRTHLLEGVLQKFEMARLLDDLDRELEFTQKMIEQVLDERLKTRLEQESYLEAYTTLLNEVVGEFFEGIMREHNRDIQKLVQVHTVRIQDKGSR